MLTGAHGFLGSYVMDNLVSKRSVPVGQIFAPRSSELDLTQKENCQKAVKGRNVVIHIAANVGGIGYNDEQAGKIFYDNMIMGVELFEAARLEGVEKFVTIGTTCCYPKVTNVPFKEEDLWQGNPDEVTGPYGLAKKMLLVQGQSYKKQYGFGSIFLIPTNLYGPRDHFGMNHSHVVPALIRKVAQAKGEKKSSVTVWGTGRATREFLYAEDAAEGIILAAEKYDDIHPVNLGTGIETSIFDLLHLIAQLCGYKGEIVWDKTKPDGQPRRCLDISKAKKYFGFEAEMSLRDGLKETVAWYFENRDSLI